MAWSTCTPFVDFHEDYLNFVWCLLTTPFLHRTQKRQRNTSLTETQNKRLRLQVMVTLDAKPTLPQPCVLHLIQSYRIKPPNRTFDEKPPNCTIDEKTLENQEPPREYGISIFLRIKGLILHHSPWIIDNENLLSSWAFVRTRYPSIASYSYIAWVTCLSKAAKGARNNQMYKVRTTLPTIPRHSSRSLPTSKHSRMLWRAA